jgi:hypothetical protein
MVDNIDVAILMRVNELAERHGVKPYEFIATMNQGTDGCRMTFEIPAETVSQQDGVLSGGESAIIDTLDSALRRAPKALTRH